MDSTPIDRRDAAAALLLASGWSWRDDAWMPPRTHMGAMVQRGWLEVPAGAVSAPNGALTGVHFHSGDDAPTKRDPAGMLHAVYSPRVLAEDECPVCSPAGLFDMEGRGPFTCYECGKLPAPESAAGATTHRYGLEIPNRWMLAPFELTEEMVRAFVDASRNPMHPAARGQYPVEAAAWDAALGAAPKPDRLPPDARMTLVPLDLPTESLEAMSRALTDRPHVDRVFPWDAQRQAWRDAILALTAMPAHAAVLYRAGDLVENDVQTFGPSFSTAA